MASSLPRAIIFDWDNTLVESWGAIAEAMNHTRAAFNLPVWTLDEVKANCTRAARESFPEWFGADWKKAYKIYYEGFDQVRQKRAIKPLPGARDLLEWLKGRGIPALVVSNKRGDYLRIEVGKVKWEGLFAAVIGAQDTPRDKPAREHVDHALNHIGVKADASIWFVGDSETDVLCARNAGCTPVIVGEAALAKKLSVDMFFTGCHALQRVLLKRSEAGDSRSAD